MPDDQVTIDPEFLPSPPRKGRGSWLPLAAVAAAAFLLGWLLRSPTPDGTTTEAALPNTTPTLETTSTTRPSNPTSSTTGAAPVGMRVPLDEAVPGFADVITMVVAGGEWGEEVEIVRWLPSQAAPETIVSFRDEPPESWEEFVGLDAAGTWYAVRDVDNVLSVRPVVAISDDEEWREWMSLGEAVGLRAISAAWHDTAPGRLAWLSCSRAPDGTGTVYTLDVADTAEAFAVARLPDGCGEMPMWISHWGDWGFALDQEGYWAQEGGWQEPNTWTVLLDPTGTELGRFESGPGDAYMVAAGPGGTVWTEISIEGRAASFLLSLDGRQRNPVPGLAEGEWVEAATWSPDGAQIALVVVRPQVDDSLIRVVDGATGESIGEVDQLGPEVWQTRWSSDGRYLLVGHDRDIWGPAGTALVVYDTVSATMAGETPMRELHYLREIRTSQPSAIAVRFTPVEWGIGPEEGWGPGVYTIRMSAQATPVLADHIEDLSGKLIWNETVVELCNIGIDDINGSVVQFGDVFQTVEGCGANPAAMQDAFDQFGVPQLACLAVTTGGVEHEHCAPLG